MQSSQASHLLKQEGTGVHERHDVPSPLQVSSLMNAKRPLPCESSQHPKQSHPFGVTGRHLAEQLAGCAERWASQEATGGAMQLLPS